MNVDWWRYKYLSKGKRCLSDFLVRFLHKFFQAISEKLNVFATYDIVETSQQVSEVTLIQGQIFSGVTLEICRFYKKIYPNTTIVLSTWEEEVVKPFQSLQDETFAIVQSEKPITPGPSNINLQIASSRSGIEYLLDQGCTHILKTRTDVLLANSTFLNYLFWIHSKGKENALVFSSFNSFLFRLFSPSDQVMFGRATDIARFWSLDLVTSVEDIDFPEKHLFKNYLESSGYETGDNLKSYLIALRDYSVIADHEQLGQIWNKGAYTALNYRWRGTKFPNPMTQLSFWQWEMLHDGFTYFEELNKKLK